MFEEAQAQGRRRRRREKRRLGNGRRISVDALRRLFLTAMHFLRKAMEIQASCGGSNNNDHNNNNGGNSSDNNKNNTIEPYFSIPLVAPDSAGML